MARKSKAEPEFIVAFAKVDHVPDPDQEDGPPRLAKGQRLEVEGASFAEMAKLGLVERGVFAEMITGVQGRSYNLKPHDKTWLPPGVYEAWKSAGICKPTEDDPEIAQMLAGLRDDLAARTSERDNALDMGQQLKDALNEANLVIAAIADQARSVIALVPENSEDVHDSLQSMLPELQKLGDMFADDQPAQGAQA